MEVHREPRANGYESVVRHGRDAVLAVPGFGDVVVTVPGFGDVVVTVREVIPAR